MAMIASGRARQRGGFVLGLIAGLLIGLALALGVALYVTRVPVPFIDRVPHRTTDDDKAEAERNRNWDPNAPLAVKPPVVPAAPAPAASAPSAVASRPNATAQPGRDPAAILSGQSQIGGATASTKTGAETFIYFVQTGAFRRGEEADQQRAALALSGFDAAVSERELSGQAVFRVRLGPFDKREDAEAAQEKVRVFAPPASLVRVERSRP